MKLVEIVNPEYPLIQRPERTDSYLAWVAPAEFDMEAGNEALTEWGCWLGTEHSIRYPFGDHNAIEGILKALLGERP